MAASERGCCVPNCGKTRKDDTILHSFPNPDNDMNRYLVWTRAVGLEPTMDPQYVYRNRRICHDHFETRFLTWTRRLSPGAFPTLLLPGSGVEDAQSRVPQMDVTNRPENVVVDDVTPSTSKGSGVEDAQSRVPLMGITNRPENVVGDDVTPSSSKGASSAEEHRKKTSSKKMGFEERTLK